MCLLGLRSKLPGALRHKSICRPFTRRRRLSHLNSCGRRNAAHVSATPIVFPTQEPLPFSPATLPSPFALLSHLPSHSSPLDNPTRCLKTLATSSLPALSRRNNRLHHPLIVRSRSRKRARRPHQRCWMNLDGFRIFRQDKRFVCHRTSRMLQTTYCS